MAEVGLSLRDVHLKMTLIYIPQVSPAPPHTCLPTHLLRKVASIPMTHLQATAWPQVMQDVSLEAGYNIRGEACPGQGWN